MEVLTLVEGQIEQIYQELDLQMKRLAQCQTQVEVLRINLQKLTIALRASGLDSHHDHALDPTISGPDLHGDL